MGEGKGCARTFWVRLPSHPSTIYRWGEKGAGPPRSHLGLGAAAKGGRSASHLKWRPSPLGFSLSHAHGPWGGGLVPLAH